MKKQLILGILLVVLCLAALAVPALAEEGDTNLDVSPLFPFSINTTTADGEQFTTTAENVPAGATLIAAAYKDGRMVEIKFLGKTGGNYSFTAENDTVKVFVFDAAMKPLAESFVNQK